MLNIYDKNFFLEIVADAVAEAHRNCRNKKLQKRWINAIARAAATILEGDTSFLHWEPEGGTLLFWSADSNEIYRVSDSGGCQCPAFNQKRSLPCYHRAMSRLIRNYFELQRKRVEIYRIDFADAVFFDPELPPGEKINLLNLSILEGRIELKPRVAALRRHISA